MRRDKSQRLPMELWPGSQATGALAALERAMQAKRGQAGRGKGVGKAADAPPCLSVNVHVKGLITEVRLTNEGDEGGMTNRSAHGCASSHSRRPF